MPPSESNSSNSLARHVESLYALARVLVGSDDAPALIRRVYDHAAEVPPRQRPSDERGWLVRRMIEAQEGTLDSAGAEVHPGSQKSFTEDPFRREVAEQTAERMLPVAFAACSIHERLILSIDVLGDPSDELLASALGTSTTNARSVRDQARSALRASLRDVLKGPERMLVDVALPNEALRSHLQELLLDRFHPPPPPLRSEVIDILEQARSEPTAENSTRLSPAFPLPSGLPRLLIWFQDRVSLRALLGALAFLIVISAGIGGGTYLLSSSPADTSPPPSVVELSVQRAPNVPVVLETQAPAEAAAFIRRTWSRRVEVPAIEAASLQGVGRLSLSPDVEVPALLYTGENGTDVIALAFSYALVDQLGNQATLAREVRSELAANDSLLTEQRNDRAVVLWRQRDDIFVVVAPNTDATSLRSRIQL